MDQNKLEEINQWIKKAWRDYYSAEKLMSGSEQFPDTAVYHCQQAVEKILKAFLTFQDIVFKKSHNLVYLINLCSQENHAFIRFRTHAEILTPYGTAFRYPSDDFEPEIEDVREAFQLSKELLEFVSRLLVEIDESD